MKTTTTPDFKGETPVTKAHPGGIAAGSTAGALAGAAAGMIAGPGGVVVGALAGGIAGAAFGQSVAEAAYPAAEEAYWSNAWRNEPYYNSAYTLDDYAPAFRHGYVGRVRSDGRTWEDMEDDLAVSWENSRHESRLDWEEARPAVRAAWDRWKTTPIPDEPVASGPP